MADGRYGIGSFISYPDKSFIQANIKELKSQADLEYVIPPKNALRLDAISYELYGRVELKWLLIYINTIVDISQLKSGVRLKYISLDKFTGYLLRTLENS